MVLFTVFDVVFISGLPMHGREVNLASREVNEETEVERVVQEELAAMGWSTRTVKVREVRIFLTMEFHWDCAMSTMGRGQMMFDCGRQSVRSKGSNDPFPKTNNKV